MRKVRPENLTQEGFVRFGSVIETDDTAVVHLINDGTCRKFPKLAALDCSSSHGRPVLHIYRATPLPDPLVIRGFERHVLGSQTFVPLDNRPYLVVVAPPGEFDIAQIKVFLAEGNQGVHFNRGTWHHFCLALGNASQFLVIDRDAPEEDCEVVNLDEEAMFQIAL